MSLSGWSGSAPNVGVAAVSGFLRGRSVLFAAPVVGLAVAIMVAPAAAQFSAQPVIIEIRAADGAAGSVITVRNESTAPMRLQVYGGDFDQPEDGSHVFMGLGEHERSCASRLEIEPDQLTLDPHGSGEVRIRMESGSETCWSLVFVEGLARGGAGIQVSQRIGVKVYGVGPGVRADGEVSQVRIDTAADGARHVDVAFGNTGTAPVRAQGELEIRSETGAVVSTLPIPPFSVLPGRTIRTRIPLAVELPAGVYLLIPILDFGGNYLAAGQALLEIEGS
jgi:hypothetical protein